MAAVDANTPASVPEPAGHHSENGSGSALTPVARRAGLAVGGWEPAPPPPELTEFSGATFVRAAKRRWLLGLGLGLAGAAAALAATWLIAPPKYQAQALLHVASRTPKGVFTEGGGYETNEEFIAYKGTQVAILKSLPVLDAAARQPQIANLTEVAQQSQPVEWLEKNLQVDTLLGPEILRISFAGEKPEQSATILNGVMDSYLKEIVRREQDKRQERMEQLKVSADNYEQVLREKRGKLRELQDYLGADDPQVLNSRFQDALGQEAAAKRKLLDTRMDLKSTEIELAAVKGAKPGRFAVSEAQVMEYLRQDPAAQRLFTQLSILEEEIQAAQSTVLPSYQPTVSAGAEKRRAAAQQSLEQRKRQARSYLEAEKVRLLESHLETAKEQVKALAAEAKQQEDAVKKWSMAISRPDKPTSDLEAMRNDLIATEATQKKVTEQLEMLKVEPRIPSRVSLLVPAQIPRERNYLPLLKGGGMAALLAFALMFFVPVLPEFRSRRIYGADEVQALGLGVLGTIPAIPAPSRPAIAGKSLSNGTRTGPAAHLPAGDTPAPDFAGATVLAESVDAVRTLLLHAAQTDQVRVVLITSACGGEGKTSLASHLAASLARARRRTLLIDADLRKPAAHRQFGLEPEPGFAEVLRGEAEPEASARATPVSNLWMMPAGRTDASAIQALAQKDVRTIFDRLKKQYDFMVLDSSPVLPVADTLSLGQHVDGVIVSVLVDVSRVPAVHSAVHRLRSLGIRILGSVVAGTKDEAAGGEFQYPISGAV